MQSSPEVGPPPVYHSYLRYLRREKVIFVVDCAPFKADEVSVNGYVVVHAGHKEKPEGYGSVSRNFPKCWKIPDDVYPSTANAEFTESGILVIDALKRADKPVDGTVIPVEIQNAVIVGDDDEPMTSRAAQGVVEVKQTYVGTATNH